MREYMIRQVPSSAPNFAMFPSGAVTVRSPLPGGGLPALLTAASPDPEQGPRLALLGKQGNVARFAFEKTSCRIYESVEYSGKLGKLPFIEDTLINTGSYIPLFH